MLKHRVTEQRIFDTITIITYMCIVGTIIMVKTLMIIMLIFFEFMELSLQMVVLLSLNFMKLALSPILKSSNCYLQTNPEPERVIAQDHIQNRLLDAEVSVKLPIRTNEDSLKFHLSFQFSYQLDRRLALVENARATPQLVETPPGGVRPKRQGLFRWGQLNGLRIQTQHLGID